MSRSNSELDRLRSGRTRAREPLHRRAASRAMLNRREFLRRGATIGMSATLLGAILAACGGANANSLVFGRRPRASGTPTKGGTLRVASQTPAAAMNPLTVADAGGLAMLNQTGEFLTFDNNLKLMLQPMLALSWTPNTRRHAYGRSSCARASSSTTAQPMTADDVVYTLQAAAPIRRTPLPRCRCSAG